MPTKLHGFLALFFLIGAILVGYLLALNPLFVPIFWAAPQKDFHVHRGWQITQWLSKNANFSYF